MSASVTPSAAMPAGDAPHDEELPESAAQTNAVEELETSREANGGEEREPRQEAKKGLSKKAVAGIAAAVLLLVVLAVVFGPSGSNSSNSSSAGGSTTAQKPAAEPDETLCLDVHGYVTLYALTELSGEQLLAFVGDKGYAFVESGANKGWENGDGSCGLVIKQGADERQVDEEGLRALAAGGAGDAVWYHLICGGYDTADKALTGLGKVTFEKRDTLGNDIAYGIVSSSRGDRFFVMAQIDVDKDVSVMLLNAGSLEAGIMAEQGKTVDELYAWCASGGTSGAQGDIGQDVVNGVFTTRAVLSHTGQELAGLAKEQGMSYNAELGGYVDAKQESFLGVLGTSGALDEEGIAQLPAGGGALGVYYMIQGGGFASASEAFGKLNSYKVLDRIEFSEHSCSGVIEGPVGKRYLVYVTDGEGSTQSYTLCVLSDEAIGAGLFRQLTQQEFGNSIDEVWGNFTGGVVGSYAVR